MKEKDPDELKDYGKDWAGFLENESGSPVIITSEWILPEGITSESESFTDTITVIYISGGDDGRQYELVNQITYSGDVTRKAEELFLIKVRDTKKRCST